MANQFPQPNFKVKTSVLVFGKGWAAPLVLYFENPEEKYKELQEFISSPTLKVVELVAQGPVKKVTLSSSQIVGVALQEEQHIV
ncbi:hypothetical protein IKA92_06470 [bacterium]|nr:hypothetical protein [bacterium]